MRQSLSKLQLVKTGIHALQALLIFVAACITIAVFTGSGSTDGRTKWFFAVCWLSLPALIYLTAVPIWSRAAVVAKALYFCIVDVLFTIFWLAAFAAVLSWNNTGIKQGASDNKSDSSDASCSTFAYGSSTQCKLSYATSSLGAVIFALFAITSGISGFYIKKSSTNPDIEEPWLAPTSSQAYAPTPGGMAHGSGFSKDPIWDTNTHDLDGRRDSDEEGHHGQEGDEYEHVRHSPDHEDDQAHQGNSAQWGPLGSGNTGYGANQYEDTAYRGGSTYQPPTATSPTAPSSPQDQHSWGRAGNQGSRGYSFSNQ